MSPKEYFSQAFLMMVGIIQASVFAFLAKEFFDYVVTAYGGVSAFSQHIFTRSGALQIDHVVLFYASTFGVIIVVTYDYLVALAHLQRAIRLADVFPTFMLGLAQIWMASSATSPVDWWASTLIFSVAGVLVYANTLTYKLDEIYASKQKIDYIGNFFRLRVALGVVSAIYVFISWQFSLSLQNEGIALGFAALVYVVVFGTVLVATGSRFSKRVASLED